MGHDTNSRELELQYKRITKIADAYKSCKASWHLALYVDLKDTISLHKICTKKIRQTCGVALS